MTKRNCLVCGKEFYTWPKRIEKGFGVYCSRGCHTIDKIKKGNITKKCLICGTEFTVNKSQVILGLGKYCSRECFFKSIRTLKEINCKGCGKLIKVHPYKLNSVKYGVFCSRECFGFWNVRHQKQKDTDIENTLKKWLMSKNIPFIEQKRIHNISVVDFFILPNICLYADGDYWHNMAERKEKDEMQTKKLIELGYNVIRLKGSEIIAGTRPVEILDVLGVLTPC